MLLSCLYFYPTLPPLVKGRRSSFKRLNVPSRRTGVWVAGRSPFQIFAPQRQGIVLQTQFFIPHGKPVNSGKTAFVNQQGLFKHIRGAEKIFFSAVRITFLNINRGKVSLGLFHKRLYP